MTTPNPTYPARRALGLPLVLGSLVLAGPLAPAGAQPPPVPTALTPPAAPDWTRAPVLPSDLNFGGLPANSPSANRANRIRLFGIQPAFASEPFGLDSDETVPGEPPTAEPDPGPDWINVTYGNDTPNFDLRQRGDPGGLGFFRVATQVQFLESDRTVCSVALQAVAPAGQEYNGLPDHYGPKVVSPAFSVFHLLDDDTAVQGFVGKNMLLQAAPAAPVRQNLQYGMAVQRSLGANNSLDPFKNFYVSLGALGQVRAEATARSAMVWEVLPGLHWKVADNCWVTGGMILPVTPTRSDNFGLWQLTCSFQF